jgi:acetyl-CoA carboxylase carboxyltransferase component
MAIVTETDQAQPSRLGLRARVAGATTAAVSRLPVTDRKVMLVNIDRQVRQGTLMAADSETIATAARAALAQRIPLVVVLASSGADVVEGMPSLDGWGRAAKALTECSGIVPVTIVAYGLAVSGPALLLGMADAVVMTGDAVAYVSGPAAVAQLTGLRLAPEELGGQRVHARSSGVATLVADDVSAGLEVVAGFLDYLPDHADEEPPVVPSGDPIDRPNPELRDLLPPSATGSYDVRHAIVSGPTTFATPSFRSPTTGSCSSCAPVGRPSWSPLCAGSMATRSGCWPTSPSRWPAPSTSRRHRRGPASSASATRSTFRC